VSLELNQIASYFPEFLIFKKNCKFHNCIHKNEPKCAVKSALKLGDISSSRYNNYLKMLNDIDGFRVNDY
jgi:ribosome biogenesis GTPase